MKNVSNQFKDTMNEVIRPATQLHFEIGTDVLNTMSGTGDLNFDTTVAPVIPPKNCMNTNFYAVVGDYVGVGDPNRICAPDDVSETPNVSVPYGVTVFTPSNTDVLIGDPSDTYNNFTGFDYPATLCFVGGHLPSVLKIEKYTEISEGVYAWLPEETITVDPPASVWHYTPSDPDEMFVPRRFKANALGAGRFQFNWLRSDVQGRLFSDDTPHPAVVFENSYISSVNISEETDLTSQALPSYEMTVECLDPDEIYTPDSDYWKYQFAEGSECFFKLGYEINGAKEYIPMFYGKLTQAPTYGQGKITFTVNIDLNKNEAWLETPSIAKSGVGTETESRTFTDIIEGDGLAPLFDSYDVFTDTDDENNSLCNHYAQIDGNEGKQLIANALGGYITAGMNTVDLHSTNNIQYKDFSDYVTRYEQVQATLESQPKVGKIIVTRNENLVSNDGTMISQSTRTYLRANEATEILYVVPYYAISRYVVNDYNKSVPDAVITVDRYLKEEINEDGTANVWVKMTSDRNAYVQPDITFYRVNNVKYDETITDYENVNGETYENNNDLVTNSYIAGKVKRVARLINDIPNVYEVDVVQDYRYELGDVIRLETQRNVFKTCVVTGLNFVMPGSNGHIACRKIFSLLDCPQAVIGAEGLKISSVTSEGDDVAITVKETSESGVVVGIMYVPLTIPQRHLYIIGATTLDVDVEGQHQYQHGSGYLTDLNGHNWSFYEISLDGSSDIVTTAPIIQLPDYTDDLRVSELTQGSVHLLQRIYEAQGMTAPVDYTCTAYPINNEGE